MLSVDREKFVEICHNSNSAADAARKLNMHFNTFKKYAIKFDCYITNQSHKGIKTGQRVDRIPTEDILEGKYPNFQTFKLKKRLIREKYKEDKCELCGWSKKRNNDEFSPCELHHKDGNPHNHRLDNLIMLCPNCHSLTDNYRSKNRATASKDAD